MVDHVLPAWKQGSDGVPLSPENKVRVPHTGRSLSNARIGFDVTDMLSELSVEKTSTNYNDLLADAEKKKESVAFSLASPADGVPPYYSDDVYMRLYSSINNSERVSAPTAEEINTLNNALEALRLNRKSDGEPLRRNTLSPLSKHSLSVEHPAHVLLRLLALMLYAPQAFVGYANSPNSRNEQLLAWALGFVHFNLHGQVLDMVSVSIKYAPHHGLYYALMTNSFDQWPWLFDFSLDTTDGTIRMENRVFWNDSSTSGTIGQQKIFEDDDVFNDVEVAIRSAAHLMMDANANTNALAVSNVAARRLMFDAPVKYPQQMRHLVLASLVPEQILSVSGGALATEFLQTHSGDYYGQSLDAAKTVGAFLDHFVATWHTNKRMSQPSGSTWASWLCPGQSIAKTSMSTRAQNLLLLDDTAVFREAASYYPRSTSSAPTSDLEEAYKRLTAFEAGHLSVIRQHTLSVVALPNNITTLPTARKFDPYGSVRGGVSVAAAPEFGNALYALLYPHASSMVESTRERVQSVLDGMRARIKTTKSLSKRANSYALAEKVLAQPRPIGENVPSTFVVDPALMVPSKFVFDNESAPVQLRAQVLANTMQLRLGGSKLWPWLVLYTQSPESLARLAAAAVVAAENVSESSGRRIIPRFESAQTLYNKSAQQLRWWTTDVLIPSDNGGGVTTLNRNQVGSLSDEVVVYAKAGPHRKSVYTGWFTLLNDSVLLLEYDNDRLVDAMLYGGMLDGERVDAYAAHVLLADMLRRDIERWNEQILSGSPLFSLGDTDDVGRDDPLVVATARMFVAFGDKLARRIAEYLWIDVVREEFPFVVVQNTDERAVLTHETKMELAGRRPRESTLDDQLLPSSDVVGPDKASVRKRKETAWSIGKLLRLYGEAPGQRLTVAHVAATLDMTTNEATTQMRQLAANARHNLAAVTNVPIVLTANQSTGLLYHFLKQFHTFDIRKPAALPRLVRLYADSRRPCLVLALGVDLVSDAAAVGWFYDKADGGESKKLYIHDTSTNTRLTHRGEPRIVTSTSGDVAQVYSTKSSKEQDNNVHALIRALRPGAQRAVVHNGTNVLLTDPAMRVILLTPTNDPNTVETRVFDPVDGPDATPETGVDMRLLSPTELWRSHTVKLTENKPLDVNVVGESFSIEISRDDNLLARWSTEPDANQSTQLKIVFVSDLSAPSFSLKTTDKSLDKVILVVVDGVEGVPTLYNLVHLLSPNVVLPVHPTMTTVIRD